MHLSSSEFGSDDLRETTRLALGPAESGHFFGASLRQYSNACIARAPIASGQVPPSSSSRQKKSRERIWWPQRDSNPCLSYAAFSPISPGSYNECAPIFFAAQAQTRRPFARPSAVTGDLGTDSNVLFESCRSPLSPCWSWSRFRLSLRLLLCPSSGQSPT